MLFLFCQAVKNVTWFDSPEDSSEATACQSVCTRLPPTLKKVLSKTVWVVSTARNAVVVVICALIAYGFDPVLDPDRPRDTTFLLTGNIQSGLPPFAPPPFETTKNGTVPVLFPEMVSDLGTALIIIPLIGILENIAIAKAFGKHPCILIV